MRLRLSTSNLIFSPSALSVQYEDGEWFSFILFGCAGWTEWGAVYYQCLLQAYIYRFVNKLEFFRASVSDVKSDFYFSPSGVDIFSCRLDREMENIYRIFQDNGYPENIVKRTIERKARIFRASVDFGPCLCPVYFNLL